ncbi:MAG: D-alanyl-D-alanine carboxypeptidase family protein, partial [bacterium]
MRTDPLANRHHHPANGLWFVAGLLLLLAGYGQPPMLAADAQTVVVPSNYARPAPAEAQLVPRLPQPIVSAGSAILIDAATGDVIFEQNADEIRPPASTTKVLTAIIALELGDPNAVVAVTEDATLTGGSRLHISTGEQIPFRELVEATMVKSGNDGAAALADYISGNQAQFVELMNMRAMELGMKNSSFQNPHGMPMEGGGNMSTARDLAILARHAMQNAEFRRVVSTGAVLYPVFGIRTDVELQNTNHLLDEFPLCTGIKTGYTNAAKHCLVASARFRDRELIGVILGADEKVAIRRDMVGLFDYGFNAMAGDYWVYRKFALDSCAYPFDPAPAPVPVVAPVVSDGAALEPE